jgi:hypothetical protein
MNTGRIRGRGFFLASGLALCVGVWLRLYLIRDQIFLDDEWHGFYYALNKTPGFLLTHFSIPGATCIPLNFYTWLVGATAGWSETLLRLPSLICGLTLVLAGPLLARPLVGTGRAALLGCFLAISPMLIFYSRICRPYSGEALLAFSAVLLAAGWKEFGGTWRAALFILTGSLAVWFHLFAVVTIAAPILAGLALGTWTAWRGPNASVDSNRENSLVRRILESGSGQTTIKGWLIVCMGMGVLIAVLVLPAFIHSLRSTFFTVAGAGRLEWQTLPRAAMLMSGTGQPVLAILFWAAVVAGALELLSRKPFLALTLLLLYPLHLLAMLIARPESGQSAIVVARYCVPLVPVNLLLVSCGIVAGLEWLQRRAALKPLLQTVVAGCAVAAFAFAGPLPQTYVGPNSFTSHGIYQHRYAPIDWRISFFSDLTPHGFPLRTTILQAEVSPFYAELAEHPGNRPVIEYPMIIGDHFNLLYYYQHFHHRRIIAGYTCDMAAENRVGAGNIYGNTYIDQVLTLVSDISKLHFRNLVSIDELNAVRATGAEYVIVHKVYEAQVPAVAPPPPKIRELLARYRSALGLPAYEDEHLAAFRL